MKPFKAISDVPRPLVTPFADPLVPPQSVERPTIGATTLGPVNAKGNAARTQLSADAAALSLQLGKQVDGEQAIQLAVDGALIGLTPAVLTPLQLRKLEESLRDLPLGKAAQVQAALQRFDESAEGARQDPGVSEARAELLGQLLEASAAHPTLAAQIEERLKGALSGPITAQTVEALGVLGEIPAFQARYGAIADDVIGRTLEALPFLSRAARLEVLSLFERKLDLAPFAADPARARQLETRLYEVLENTSPNPAPGPSATYEAKEAASRGEFLIECRAADALSNRLVARLQAGDDIQDALGRVSAQPYGSRVADAVLYRFKQASSAPLPEATKAALIDLVGKQCAAGLGEQTLDAVVKALLGRSTEAEQRTLAKHLLRGAYLQDSEEHSPYALGARFEGIVALLRDKKTPAAARSELEAGLLAVSRQPLVPGGDSSQQHFYNASILLARTVLTHDPKAGELRDALREAQHAADVAAQKDAQIPGADPPPSFHALFATADERATLQPAVKLLVADLQHHLQVVIPDLEGFVRQAWAPRDLARLSLDRAVVLIDEALANPSPAMIKGGDLLSSGRMASLVRGGGIGAVGFGLDSAQESLDQLRRRVTSPAVRSDAIFGAALKAPRSFTVEGEAQLPMPRHDYGRDLALGSSDQNTNFLWMVRSLASSLDLAPTDKERLGKLTKAKLDHFGIGLPHIVRAAVKRAKDEGRPLRVLEVSDKLGSVGVTVHSPHVWQQLMIDGVLGKGGVGVESVTVSRRDLLPKYIEHNSGKSSDTSLELMRPALGLDSRPYKLPAPDTVKAKLDELLDQGAHRRMSGRSINTSLEQLQKEGQRFDLVIDTSGVLASADRVGTLELMQGLLVKDAVGLVLKRTVGSDYFGRREVRDYLRDEVNEGGVRKPLDQALAEKRPQGFIGCPSALLLIGTAEPLPPLKVRTNATEGRTTEGYPVAEHQLS